MRIELDHFYIGEDYGSNQDRYTDLWMNRGGCGATVATESLLFFEKYKGFSGLCPFDVHKEITTEAFIDFAMSVKPYLRPRITGIDKLDTFIAEFEKYFSDQDIRGIRMTAFHGTESLADAKAAVLRQLEEGWIIPYLLLNHKDPDFEEFYWHWFLLNGAASADALTADDYMTDVMRPAEDSDHLFVKTATYGEAEWLDFDRMWETGHRKVGGMILYELI